MVNSLMSYVLFVMLRSQRAEGLAACKLPATLNLSASISSWSAYKPVVEGKEEKGIAAVVAYELQHMQREGEDGAAAVKGVMNAKHSVASVQRMTKLCSADSWAAFVEACSK